MLADVHLSEDWTGVLRSLPVTDVKRPPPPFCLLWALRNRNPQRAFTSLHRDERAMPRRCSRGLRDTQEILTGWCHILQGKWSHLGRSDRQNKSHAGVLKRKLLIRFTELKENNCCSLFFLYFIFFGGVLTNEAPQKTSLTSENLRIWRNGKHRNTLWFGAEII